MNPTDDQLKGPSCLRPLVRPGSRAAKELLRRLAQQNGLDAATHHEVTLSYQADDTVDERLKGLKGRSGWIRQCYTAFSLDARFSTEAVSQGVWGAIKSCGLVYVEFLSGIEDNGNALTELQCTKLLGLQARIANSRSSDLHDRALARLDTATQNRANGIWGKYFEKEIKQIDGDQKLLEVRRKLVALRERFRGNRRILLESANIAPEVSPAPHVRDEVARCRADLTNREAELLRRKENRLAAAASLVSSHATVENQLTVRWHLRCETMK